MVDALSDGEAHGGGIDDLQQRNGGFEKAMAACSITLSPMASDMRTHDHKAFDLPTLLLGGT